MANENSNDKNLNLKNSLLLYLITDRRWLSDRNLCEDVEKALKGGVSCVQLREKNLKDKELENLALEIKSLCRSYNVPIIINDDVVLTKKINADGVHLGKTDEKILSAINYLGNSFIIGASANSVTAALEAEKNGAHYLGVGDVFGTNSKQNAKKISLDVLKDIKLSVKIPVVAIGGINSSALSCLDSNHCDGVAVMSTILSKDDIEAEAKELFKMCEGIFYA